jgi:hypothetical protein
MERLQLQLKMYKCRQMKLKLYPKGVVPVAGYFFRVRLLT